MSGGECRAEVVELPDVGSGTLKPMPILSSSSGPSVPTLRYSVALELIVAFLVVDVVWVQVLWHW